MTPGEELCAAADKLRAWVRALADERSAEGWTVDSGRPCIDGDDVYYDVNGPWGGWVARAQDEPTAAYIAAMDPNVGADLAAWLDAIGQGVGLGLTYHADESRALTLARRINGKDGS